MTSRWDRGLPRLVLNDVSIHAASPVEAWKTFSTRHLLRSVLVAPDAAMHLPFTCESASCTVQDLYDAFADTYGLAWVQDEQTGVSWFHPAALSYDRILSTRVHVARDQPGLPMQSGMLEPLESGCAPGFAVKRWDAFFQNTFNYAVDIPAGGYTLRDLLNLCCIANQTKTFLVQLSPDGAFVTAVNLVSDETAVPPIGALDLWDKEIGKWQGTGLPSQDRIMAKLADRETEVRRAARNYLEAIIWSVPIDAWATTGSSTAQTLLWTCIGLASVLVRSEEATHRASIQTMERLATGDFLEACEPALAVMTAFDLARLAKDKTALEFVGKRTFTPFQLSGVASDACRAAALSGYLRDVLQAGTADAIMDSMKPLSAIVCSATPGKLDFRSEGQS